MLQNPAGHTMEPQRRKYADCISRILKIVDDYPNWQIMDYLQTLLKTFLCKIFYRISYSGLLWKKDILTV